MTELLINQEESLATVSLNAPERRNALSVLMLDELETSLESLASDVDVRAVLLKGEGEFFCAGFDLGAIVDGQRQDGCGTRSQSPRTGGAPK